MKKNVVGHMIAKKESAGARIRRLGLLPRLLCLLLALVLWLAITNLNNKAKDGDDSLGMPDTEQTA